MRLTVFILFVTVSCCCGHKGKQRGRSYSRSKNAPPPYLPPLFPRPPTSTGMPPTTRPPPPRPISFRDDFLSEEIGVRIPPKICTLKYDDFVEHVVDMDWISPYDIDNDSPINPEITFKWQPRWDVVNETHVRRRGSYWDNLTEKCTFADGLFIRRDDELAIFGATSGRFAETGRLDYIVSLDPTKYLIQGVCYDGKDIRRSRCPNSEILLLIKEQRGSPNGDGVVTGDICMDDIPWSLIETTFRVCFGQQFVDKSEPQIMWLWEGEDCAKPGTAAFEREIAKRK